MKWLRIILFYFIAILGSYWFRIIKPDFVKLIELPFGLSLLKHAFEGIGPLLGAIIIILLFKPKRTITFWGSSVKKSLLMLLIPVVLFIAFGVSNTQGINIHWYGFVVILTSLIYVIFEEIGWRAYLLEELQIKQLSPFLRAVIIGAMWYIWHLNFNITSETIVDHLFLLGFLIFASWGFEKIIDSTKSVVSVACFHLLGSILGYNQLIQNGIETNSRYLIIGTCLALWITIVSKWNKKIRTNKV